MAQALDIVLEEGENLRSLLIGILSAEDLGMLKAQAARPQGAALGSVIGKLMKVLQRQQQRREQFADGLSVQEYEVVHLALDLWS
jgi:hypothetical protein